MKRLFLILAFLLFAVPAYATQWYVATAGSDSSYMSPAGDIAHPFLTGSFAVLNPSLACGDTINFRTGTYTGGIGITYGLVTHCSSWASPIIMQAYTPDSGTTWETVTLKTTDATYGNVIGLSADGDFSTTRAMYWTIRHFTFNLDTSPLTTSAALSGLSISFIRFEDNIVTNTQNQGIFMTNNNDTYDVDGWEVRRNHFVHTGLEWPASGRPHHAIYLTKMVNPIIEDNILEDATGYGCQINSTGAIIRRNTIFNNGLSVTPGDDPLLGNGTGGCNFGNGSGNQFYNNLVYHNGAIGIQENSACVNCTVYNNTSWNNGINIGLFGSSGVIVRGNISLGSAFGDITATETTSVTVTDNLFSAANATYPSNDACSMGSCDDTITAFTAYNFVPPAMSPALDNSPDLRAIFTTDILSHDRAAGDWDQGAYQVTGLSCTPAKVLFTVQPASAAIGASLGSVAAGIYSSGNALCFTATDAITFAKTAGATWNSLQVTSGSLTNSPIAGVVTLSTMYVSPTTGSGTITASAAGLTSAISDSITISSTPSNPCASPPCTFYISYTDGNDAFSGLDKMHPWKHAPGMTGAGALPEYLDVDGVDLSGYRMIFKGGDTWPAAVLMWTLRGKGTGLGTDSYYFGVDQSWYTGSSWTRPIINLGGSGGGFVCQNTYFGKSVAVLANPDPYRIFDNFELTGLYWDHTCPDDAPIYIGVNIGIYNEWKNLYFHGWAFEYSGAGGIGSCRYAGGRNCDFAYLMYGDGGAGSSIHDSVFDGWDVDHTYGNSAYGIRGQGAADIYRNYFNYLTSGQSTIQAITAWHENNCNHIGVSMSTQHDQCYQDNGSQDSYVYNNVVTNSTAGQGFLLGPVSGKTGYFFNNVIFSSELGSATVYCQDTNHSVQSGTCHYFNNTFYDLYSTLAFGCGYFPGGGPSAQLCNYQNNHVITDTANFLSSCNMTMNSCSQDHNTVQTLAAAATDGFSDASTPPYFPTSAGADTIGAGTSLSGYCSLNAYVSALCSTSSFGIAYNGTTHAITGPGFSSILGRDWTNSGAYQYTGGSPLISNISPNNGVPGNNVDILVTGVNTSFDADVTVPSSSCGTMALAYWTRYSTSSALVTFAIDSGASTSTCTIIMTTGAEVASITNGFTINATLLVPRVTPRRFRKI